MWVGTAVDVQDIVYVGDMEFVPFSSSGIVCSLLQGGTAWEQAMAAPAVARSIDKNVRKQLQYQTSFGFTVM
jgi:hypothetical protein